MRSRTPLECQTIVALIFYNRQCGHCWLRPTTDQEGNTDGNDPVLKPWSEDKLIRSIFYRRQLTNSWHIHTLEAGRERAPIH